MAVVADGEEDGIRNKEELDPPISEVEDPVFGISLAVLLEATGKEPPVFAGGKKRLRFTFWFKFWLMFIEDSDLGGSGAAVPVGFKFPCDAENIFLSKSVPLELIPNILCEEFPIETAGKIFDDL